MDATLDRATRLLVLAALGAQAMAQPDWTLRPSGLPPGRSAHTMAYDSRRGVTVLVGGGFFVTPSVDTWEYDGTTWAQRIPAVLPPFRSEAAMAYDSVRGVCVLFGGLQGAVYLGDTWEWDGIAWAQKFPAVAPTARQGARMTWDPIRRRVVLFGGWDNMHLPTRCTNDLWEWDGTVWTDRSPATRPARRAWFGFAFDDARGVAVVQGGTDAVQRFYDTWEWDGSVWSQVGTLSFPGIQHAFPMTYHPALGGVLVLGTPFPPTLPASTWLWDGRLWRDLGIPQLVSRTSAAMSYDSRRGRAVLFGGSTIGLLGDQWELGAQGGWTPWPGAPPNRLGGLMCFDRLRQKVILWSGTVIVGSLSQAWDDLWEWDGAAWTRRDVGAGPFLTDPLAGQMAFDSTRGRSLAFIGYRPAPARTETWDFDGSTWTLLAPRTSPSLRSGAALAFDAIRARVVLFGGDTNDTWEWDGTSWIQRFPVQSPPVRSAPLMTFDSRRGVTVIHGGYAGSTVYADTWEWDGTDWTQRISANAPPVRSAGVAFYDERRGRTVIFGGRGAGGSPSGNLNDTWEWDGTDWTQVATTGPARGRFGSVAAYDAARGRGIVFGGGVMAFLGVHPLDETLIWEDRTLAASPAAPLPGETVVFNLTLQADAGLPYVAAASFGTHPGIPVPGGRIFPGNLDPLLMASLGANNAVFSGFQGVLDAQGGGVFRIHLPPSGALSGVRFSVAAVTLSAGAIRSITNAVEIAIR